MAAQTASQPQLELDRLVRRWDRRLRGQQTTLWLPRTILAGLVIGVGAALFARVQPWLLSNQLVVLAAAFVLLALLAMVGIIWLWPRSTLQAARYFDRKLSLRERVSTALELLDERIHTLPEFREEQLADALSHAQAARATDALPLVWRWREWGAVALAALVFVLLLLLPNPQAEAAAQQGAQEAEIAAARDELQRITEEIAADPALDSDERRELLEALQASMDTLREPDVTLEESFAALTDAQTALEDAATNQQEQGLGLQNSLSQSDQPLVELDGAPEAAPEATGAQAMPGLQSLAQNLQTMTPQQLQAAAQALQQAAQNAGQNSSNQGLTQALQQAAQALQQGDVQQGQQALDEAAAQSQQLSQAAQNQQQTAQQLSQSAQTVEQAADDLSQQGPDSGDPGGQSQPSEQQPGEASNAQAQQGQQLNMGDTASPQSMPGQGDNPGQQQGGQAGQPAAGSPQAGSQGEGSQPLGGAEGASGDPSQQGSAGGAGPGAGDNQGGAGSDQGSAPATGEQAPQNNNPDGSGVGQMDMIYAPQRLGGSGGPEIQLDPNAAESLVQEGDFAENPDGPVTVPYSQVFADYSGAASQALESGYIPLGLRDVVRQYFTSLEPNRGGSAAP